MKHLIGIITLALLFSSCGNNTGGGNKGSGKISITAAGATFPLPF